MEKIDLPADITLISEETMSAITCGLVNPGSVLLIIFFVNNGRADHYILPEHDGRMSGRVEQTIHYLKWLFSIDLNGYNLDSGTFASVLFQADDAPVDYLSVSWQRKSGWAVSLIPDLYYFQQKGYFEFMPRERHESKAWSDRRSVALWRGSSTGLHHQTVDTIRDLPRYKLCESGLSMGSLADFGITDVVQTMSQVHKDDISIVLQKEGIMREFMNFSDMERYKYLVDIDGNANSWNFIAKLRLGSCVLKVASTWEQWFSSRLAPWFHYVPVNGDLSDIQDKVKWCIDNDDEAMCIARNGREFALEMDYSTEMRRAALTLRQTSELVS